MFFCFSEKELKAEYKRKRDIFQKQWEKKRDTKEYTEHCLVWTFLVKDFEQKPLRKKYGKRTNEQCTTSSSREKTAEKINQNKIRPPIKAKITGIKSGRSGLACKLNPKSTRRENSKRDHTQTKTDQVETVINTLGREILNSTPREMESDSFHFGLPQTVVEEKNHEEEDDYRGGSEKNITQTQFDNLKSITNIEKGGKQYINTLSDWVAHEMNKVKQDIFLFLLGVFNLIQM